MKCPARSTYHVQFGLSLFGLTLAACLLSGALPAAENGPPKKAAPPPKRVAAKPTKTLTGPELYAVHCNRCHPERYAPERSDAQWQTILLHMRTRANLPAAQARTILKYLQEDSGK